MNTGMIWRTNSISSEGTEQLGVWLGSQLGGGEVIELRSDLGGGKTTFVNGLARGAKSEDRVSSPTFTLSRIYNAKGFDISHFDFYRLDEPGLLADQLAEAINNSNVVVVEWADVVSDVLPAKRLTIEFEPTASSPDERKITFNYPESMSFIIEFLQTKQVEIKP
jgi:tRNA threonylcarbamoyladenosine biosynthesis protein TsaE